MLSIALPKGRLMGETASLLERVGWGFDDYKDGTRSYRLHSRAFPDLSGKIFQERDIPIQVAVGNYDLGICGLDWVEELLSKYPSAGIVKVRDLGYGQGAVYALGSLRHAANSQSVRLASEYPNLAESFATKLRLKRFSVFPLWGAAEAYPPENAEVVLLASRSSEKLDHGLAVVGKVMDFSACLIANRQSWECKDLSAVLVSLGEVSGHLTLATQTAPSGEVSLAAGQAFAGEAGEDIVRLALPDGHQQEPTVELLKKAGVQIDDYPSATGNRRPISASLGGVVIKVIRPQDMPLQVANGNFDLAITGKDWLTEHLNQFPGSPVVELLDLKFGWVRIVAVVGQDVPADSTSGLRRFWAGSEKPVRVASEYANIADKYARDNHLGLYRVIPTWGATEAFLPEDADVLIENTQTGRTLAQHNLKIIDTIFESTARLIANKDSLDSSKKAERIKGIVDMLRRGVE